MIGMTMEDCKFYEERFHRCMALNELVCARNNCSFYKPRSEDADNKREDKTKA